jgi:hypothetical protein
MWLRVMDFLDDHRLFTVFLVLASFVPCPIAMAWLICSGHWMLGLLMAPVGVLFPVFVMTLGGMTT